MENQSHSSLSPISSLEVEIEKIQERNRRVEADKAWEISWFRIILVSGIIYIVAVIFMIIIRIENPWLNGLIPAGGYFFSEQSLPFIKRWWLKYLYRK